MTTKRPIAPLALVDVTFGLPPTSKPELTWISPNELLVDESYQRALSEKGLKLIRRIVEHFDWRRFKPPTAVWTDEGLEVIDGQHSAIAAATHPDIATIPIVIVEGADVKDRAASFLGINQNRLGVTPMQIHAAAIVAGDEDAVAIERVCAACGVQVLRMPPSRGAYKPRDTVAVRALGDLVKRVGEELAVEVVRVLADADLAPITSAQLRAAEAILNHADYAGLVDPAELTKAIVALGPEAEREAGVFAETHGVQRWRGLVAVWFKKAKKRRKAEVREPQPGLEENPGSPGANKSEVTAGESRSVEKSDTERPKGRHYQPFRDGTYAP